jgi:RNA polymerase primary sigma factor
MRMAAQAAGDTLRGGGGTGMSRSEDTQLVQAARSGDRRARETLVAENLVAVRSLAAHYRDLGLPLDDLVQEGSVGLLEAIAEYDAARGADFATYARFRIRRAIRNALTEKSRLIRLPKQVVERRRAIERADAGLTAARGHAPTVQELAAAVGLPSATVAETRSLAGVPISLDQSVLPDGSTLETVVADATALDPAVEAVEHEQAELIDLAVGDLPARQREIVTRHFGLGRPPEEIAQVASALHLSQQRTRTIERDALYALRDRLEAEAQSSESLSSRWKRLASSRAASSAADDSRRSRTRKSSRATSGRSARSRCANAQRPSRTAPPGSQKGQRPS